jgi:hypothetical protein
MAYGLIARDVAPGAKWLNPPTLMRINPSAANGGSRVASAPPDDSDSLRRYGSKLNPCSSQTTVQVAAPCNRPPIVKERLYWFPIGDPAENDETLLKKSAERSRAESCGDRARRKHACCQCAETYSERASANPKQITEVTVNRLSTVGEISAKRRRELSCGVTVNFARGSMNDDSEGVVARKFASPTYDVLFCISIEVALAKRKRIERVEKLNHFFDTYLNGTFSFTVRHRVAINAVRACRAA